MRFRRFFALPDAPFDGLNFSLSTEVYVDPSLFARPQTWEIKSYSLSIVASSQFKFSIVRRGRYSDAIETDMADDIPNAGAILYSWLS